MKKVLITLISCTLSFLVSYSASSFVFRGIPPVVLKTHVNAELQPYVQDYFDLIKKHCSSDIKFPKNYLIDIVYTPKKKDEVEWIGVCMSQLNGFTILFKNWWWEASSIASRKQTVFHEMAHCLIGAKHSDDPYNYMYREELFIYPEVFIVQAELDIIEYCSQ